MKCFLQLSFLFIASLFTANVLNAQTIDLDVKGIKVSASYKSIVKKLGRPDSNRRGGEVPCGGAMRTLRYKGLILRLEVGGENPLGLYKVEVSSRNWPVAGVQVGDNKAKIIRKFGTSTQLKEKGKLYLPYFIEDGYARFYFSKNRLMKIEWEFNFC